MHLACKPDSEIDGRLPVLQEKMTDTEMREKAGAPKGAAERDLEVTSNPSFSLPIVHVS